MHYNDVIMSAMASQITSRAIVYSAAYSSADQRKHQSSASLAFVRGIHRWLVNSPHKGPVTRKMLHFHGAIMDSVIRGPRTSASTIYYENKTMCVFAFICIIQWHSEMFSFKCKNNMRHVCHACWLPGKTKPQNSGKLILIEKVLNDTIRIYTFSNTYGYIWYTRINLHKGSI